MAATIACRPTPISASIWRRSALRKSRRTAGASGDAKANAAVQFAAKVVRERGHVTGADIKAVRDAGYSDGQIVEILAVTAENVFTNLLNVVAETDIDFPVVHAAEAA